MFTVNFIENTNIKTGQALPIYKKSLQFLSEDCCSMTLLTFRPLSTSQLATLSMSTSTSQSVELVVDVNVAVSGASCRQRLSVSSVVTPFLMTSHSVLRRRQNWRHISIFILKLYHIWITLSLVLQCCTSDFVSLSLSLSLSVIHKKLYHKCIVPLLWSL